MANLIRLNRVGRTHADVFFSKHELGQILSEYSAGVIKGDWRDYAIDRSSHVASFSIFRRTLERPVYAFIKWQKPGQTAPVFALLHGPKIIMSSPSLSTVMDRFKTIPKLVHS